MTPKTLRTKIKSLNVSQPITSRFERELAIRHMWDYERESKKYNDQRDHWLGWLSEYDGPGAYDRKGGENRDAKYSYNHIQCPPMQLWLGEAAGIPKAIVQSAMNEALKAKKTYASQCKAIRDVIPWESIKEVLKKVKYTTNS